MRSSFPHYFQNTNISHQVTPLQQLATFTPQSLTKVSQNLDRFLPSALIDAQYQLQRLSSPKTVAAIIQKAASWFVDEFSIVEQAITRSDGVEFSRTVWPRTVKEVRVLLS